MWSQIVGTLVVLIVATYALQLVLPQARRSARRTSVRWDVAPVVGFFGILLLALSFTEAWRGSVIEVWLAGIVVGLIVSAFLWIALGTLLTRAPRPGGSALLATIRLLWRFGLPVVLALIGIYLAAHFIGAMVEVFVAGSLGAAMIMMAIWIFLVSRQTKTE